MSIAPPILNKAMEAYVQTFPTKDNLTKHISKEGLDSDGDEITKELQAVINTAEDHLYNYPGGVPWTKDFESEFETMMRARHPWLDKNSMDRVFSFSQWMCWHDGLNRST